MISPSLLSNYIGSFLGMGVSKGLRFLAVAYCIRTVGDYTWGQTVSTVTLFTFLGLLVDQGLGVSPILFHLRNRSSDRRLLLLISCYRLCMAVLLIAGLHLFHHFVHALDGLVLVYSLVLIPRALGLEWWFYRRELYQLTHYIASVRTVVFFLSTIAWVEPSTSPTTLLVIELLSEAASTLFAYSLIKLGGRNGLRGEAPTFTMGGLLRYSFPFLLISLLVSSQSYLDILILRVLSGSQAVGQYDVGIKFAFLYLLASVTIIQVVRPKLTRLFQDGDTARIGVILRTVSSLFMVVATPLLILSLYFSPHLTSLLFGNAYDVTVFVFRWSSVWVFLSFTALMVADTLLSLEKRRLYVWCLGAAVTTNILANVMLQQTWGPHAAIVAKMAGEAVLIATAYLMLPRSIRHEISGPLKFLLATLAAFQVVFVASRLSGQETAGAILSILGAGVLVWKRGVFSRKTWSVLRDN